MILFTADWHIKLGQKNVPVPWACTRYQMFFEQVQEAIDEHGVTPCSSIASCTCSKNI